MANFQLTEADFDVDAPAAAMPVAPPDQTAGLAGLAAQVRHLTERKQFEDRRAELAMTVSSFTPIVLASANDAVLDSHLVSFSSTLLGKRKSGNQYKYQDTIEALEAAIESVKSASTESEVNRALRAVPASRRRLGEERYSITADGALMVVGDNPDEADYYGACDLIKLAGCTEDDSIDIWIQKLSAYIRENFELIDASWAVDVTETTVLKHNTTFPHATRVRPRPRSAMSDDSNNDEERDSPIDDMQMMQYVVGAGRKPIKVPLEFVCQRQIGERDPTLHDLKVAIERIASRKNAQHTSSDAPGAPGPLGASVEFELYVVPAGTSHADAWAGKCVHPIATNDATSYFTVKDGGIVDEHGKSRVMVDSFLDTEIDVNGISRSVREYYKTAADIGNKVVFNNVQFHVNATSENTSTKRTEPEFRFVAELKIFGVKSLVHMSRPFVTHARVK